MIPRVEPSLLRKILVGIYALLVALPLGLAAFGVIGVIYLALNIVALPWTLIFYSSNWGLKSRDRKITRVYAEQAQTTNPTINNMLRLLPSTGAISPHIQFYPHRAERSFFCFPGFGAFSVTRYTYPKISELFSGLEDAGWQREMIYDLFSQVINDEAGREKIKEVRRRVCRGDVISKIGLLLHLPLLLFSWVDPPVNMWKADRAVVDVDMTSVDWILAGNSLIRPRDMKTLIALDKLNGFFGIWKFVQNEGDLNATGCWQYIVM